MGADRVQVQVSSNGLKATARIAAGPTGGPDQVRAALDQSGVTFGIDERACSQIGKALAHPRFTGAAVLLAEGVPPTNGEDAEWILSFEPHVQPGTLRDDGTFDFRQRQLFTAVKTGDVIAARKFATAGREGTTVTGDPIPAEDGRDVTTMLGEGVDESEDGKIRAIRDGVVKHVAGKLFDVVDHSVHSGDVDLRSGHLETGGSLKVNGSVELGMVVRAGGDVEVTRNVDGGSIFSDGNVTIGGDLVTRGGAVLSARGSAMVRRIQGATAQCGQLFAVQKDSVDSDISAGEIQIAGRLVGGVARAETRLEVRKAGSPRGAGTVLAVAEPLAWPVDVARAAHREAAVLRNAKRRAMRDVQSQGRLKGGKMARQARSLEEESLARLAELRRRRTALLPSAEIVADFIHSGTTVRFGVREKLIDASARSVRFRFDSDSQEILTESLP